MIPPVMSTATAKMDSMILFLFILIVFRLRDDRYSVLFIAQGNTISYGKRKGLDLTTGSFFNDDEPALLF
jgi:hypothetical protein